MDHIATPIPAAPTSNKRLTTALIAIIGLAVLAAAGFLPSLFSADNLTRDIELQIRQATGLSTTVAGPVHFSILPQPVVEITDVGMADPSGALRLNADSLTGYLRFLPLLAGRFEIAHARLIRPAVVLNLDGHLIAPGSAIGRAANDNSPASLTNAAAYTRLGSVDLVDGRARLQSRSARFDRVLEDVNISVDWPKLDAAATVTGRFKVHDEPIDLAAWFAQPLQLIRGGESALTLTINSNVINLATSGSFVSGPQLQYRGHLETQVASLRRLAELTGHSFPSHGRFADLDLKCDANFLADTAALSNLRLELDGNDYEGTLAIQAGDEKPLVSGTLATNYLDLAPFLSGLPPPLTRDRTWNMAPLDTADLGFADLDLRVSATRLRLAEMEFRDSALSLITRTGSMDLTLAEATANHGKVKGRVSLAVQNSGLTLRATGSLKGFRLRPLPVNVDGQHELTGLLNGTLALDSTGVSIGDLMRNIEGKAQIDIDSGQITQLDLDSFLSLGTSRQNGAAATEAKAPLDGASLVLKVQNGRAEIESGRLETRGMHLVFGGDTNLAERTFNLWALTQQQQTADAEETPTQVNLVGSWDAPHLTVEHVKPSHPPAQILPRHGGSMPGNALSYAPGQE